MTERTSWDPVSPTLADLDTIDAASGPCRVDGGPIGPGSILVSDLTAEVRRLRGALADCEAHDAEAVRALNAAEADIRRLTEIASRSGEHAPAGATGTADPAGAPRTEREQ